MKFYDQKLSLASLTAATDATGGEHNPSATIALNTVVQGDGESNRDGRQIVMRNLSLRGNISVAPQVDESTTDRSELCFVSIILDTQTNGALLNSEDVYKNVLGTALGACQPFRNLKFSKRFRVLATKTITLPQQEVVHDGTNIEVGGFVVPFEMYVNLKNMTVNYSSTSESIANITDNSISVIAWTTGTASAPILNYATRLRFVG